MQRSQDANGKRHSLSISSITCTPRNSNIEILRIIAMLCIAFNHFPWPAQDIVGSGSFVERLPMSLLLSLISNLGGIGDCLFFFISAWYICEESANYKRQFKRVWILERELLFWSLLLLSGDLISQGLDLQETYSKKHLIKHIIIGIFPFSSNHWWFPTNYMMFLLVVPALSVGLKKTGKQLHKILSIILLIFFGFIPFGIVDRFSLGAPRIDYSLWLFIYQFVLVTYLRWYKSDWLKSKSLMLKFMWIGGACDVITQSIGATLISTTSNEYITTEFLWMNCASCIPTMMFALGLLASAQQKKQKHSRVINKIASATLTVYLLFTDPFASSLISIFMRAIPLSGVALFFSSVIACLALFTLSILLGFIRQTLFRVTIDRHRGHWFELLWNKTFKWMLKHQLIA